MFVVFMIEEGQSCEREPPRDPRFIGVPPGEPVPGPYRHLGIVTVDGKHYSLYCPDFHLPAQSAVAPDDEIPSAPASPTSEG
jgi:hypothetical protein